MYRSPLLKELIPVLLKFHTAGAEKCSKMTNVNNLTTASIRRVLTAFHVFYQNMRRKALEIPFLHGFAAFLIFYFPEFKEIYYRNEKRTEKINKTDLRFVKINRASRP